MPDDDPNEAYEVVPIEPGPHGPPHTWWTVKRNGIPVRHFSGKETAERFATDREYRASKCQARDYSGMAFASEGAATNGRTGRAIRDADQRQIQFSSNSADPYQTVKGWLLSYRSLTRGLE